MTEASKSVAERIRALADEFPDAENALYVGDARVHTELLAIAEAVEEQARVLREMEPMPDPSTAHMPMYRIVKERADAAHRVASALAPEEVK